MRRPKGFESPETPDYVLKSSYTPRGDQPHAIDELTDNLNRGVKAQTLLGVTGSGKTFAVANVLSRVNRPALVIAPNKTLAAQLYNEFKEFFPENRVRYFVSYYDYYQPEAYVPSTDTFIEKDSAINEEIDKMRHSATRAILESRDTIVVASVSCIYGLGAPEDYFDMMLFLEEGQVIDREEVIKKLVLMQYKRSDYQFSRGNFRVTGETIDIFPADEDSKAFRVLFFGDEVEKISEIDSLSGASLRHLGRCAAYPVSHFVAGNERVKEAVIRIRAELGPRLIQLQQAGKLLEAQRLEQRTQYDLELMQEIGFCPGIENYSRHLAGRGEGDRPTTLIDYFPKDYVLVIDESHVTCSQIGGMYRGDRSRKQTLVDFGFRLPSALDNRPLNGEEFWKTAGQTIFVSATPSDFELERSEGIVVEMINRPTGLLDPVVEIHPAKNQVDHLMGEIRTVTERGERVLVLTLTKKMAEDLSGYFREAGIRARWIHSDVTTVERVEILRGLRKGDFDVLIGINLLREGLDLVEVSLVTILDADKEGFLRSTRSLIQIMGRAARNVNGKVILYADRRTKSIDEAIAETDRRRAIQREYNRVHGIVPQSAKSEMPPSMVELPDLLADKPAPSGIPARPDDPAGIPAYVETLRGLMFACAARREYERAAELRDYIKKLQEAALVVG